MLNCTRHRDATSEPPQKKQKVADGQENAVPTESTPPGESTQQAINVAAPNSGVGGGGVHLSGCNSVIVNYYDDRKNCHRHLQCGTMNLRLNLYWLLVCNVRPTTEIFVVLLC